MCRAAKVFFHTDAAQAVGKIPVDVNELKVDLMSISAHKLYGPKGVGAIYMRRRPRVRLEPQMSGGGQERGIRSGTLPHPLVVGFGAACRVASEEMERDHRRAQPPPPPGLHWLPELHVVPRKARCRLNSFAPWRGLWLLAEARNAVRTVRPVA